jgi:hypothetical protein
MVPELRYIVQWAQAGAPAAKDPRNKLFKSLFLTANIDPHTLIVRKDKASDNVTISLKLSYITPDIAALKKKKLVMVRQTKELKLLLEPRINGRVYLSHSREMYALTLEEVLALWNLYLIFSDTNKAKLFQKLVQEEIEL